MSKSCAFLHGNHSSATPPLGRPLPAIPDPGDSVVDAGDGQGELQNQHCTGDHQAQHEPWRGEPLVGGRLQKLVPSVEKTVSGARRQGEVSQFGLRRRERRGG